MSEMRSSGLRGLAVIGYGEAGKALVAGLREDNPDMPIHLYDILFAEAEGAAMREKAAEVQAACHDSNPAAVTQADIVLSTVVAKAAPAVAEAAAAAMRPGQVFIDLNSAAPRTKQQVAEILAPSGCTVLDGAILAPVPPHRHRVPILLCGPSAGAVTARLNSLGFNAEDGGENIGAAAATRLLRSTLINGIEALRLACAPAASHFGITERILDSLQQSLPGGDWPERARYLVSRTAVHGERRAVEMTEVAAMLRDIGMEPMMAEAAARRIAWGTTQDLKDALVNGDFPSVSEMEKAFARRRNQSL